MILIFCACMTKLERYCSDDSTDINKECSIDSRNIETAVNVLYKNGILSDLDLEDTLFINLSRSLNYVEKGFPKSLHLGGHKMVSKFGLSGSPLVSFMNPSYKKIGDSVRILEYHVRYIPGCSYKGKIIYHCVEGSWHFVSIGARVGPICH